MAGPQHLVYSIIQFLDDEITSGSLSEDAVESLEVARQCLETAYGVSLNNTDLKVNDKLLDIFVSGVTIEPQDELSINKKIPTLAEKAEAEQKKQEGNEVMKTDKYMEAMNLYSLAIDLDPTNAVYYCNRAASHSKLGDHKSAILDCRRALKIEPDYSKAFSRMGSAHSALFQYEAARDCYKRATELEPSNETYHINLKTAEQKLEEVNQSENPGAGGIGGMDISAIMNSPAIMNMAQSLMSNPQMSEMMSGLLQNAGQGGAASGMGNLFTTTYNLAQQMQQQNPELVEQLRSQMSTSGNISTQNNSENTDQNDS